jgi:hypothetical protein
MIAKESAAAERRCATIAIPFFAFLVYHAVR